MSQNTEGLKNRINVLEEENEPNKPDLKSTKTNPEQLYVAWTYYIAKQPVNNVHGLFKVVCTGPTSQAVDLEVKRLIDQNELEETLPFINIAKTGTWRKLVPGGDPKSNKEIYEPASKTVKTMAIMDNHQRRANAEKELRERQRMLLDEQEKEEDEFSYDRYVILRNRLMDYDFKEKEMEDRKKAIHTARIKITNQLNNIESKMGNYKIKFAKRMHDQITAQQDQMQNISDQINSRRQEVLNNEKSNNNNNTTEEVDDTNINDSDINKINKELSNVSLS